MGTFSIWHWVIVAVIVLVLFGGGGKLSKIMGDLGKGLKDFKKNVKDDPTPSISKASTSKKSKSKTSKSKTPKSKKTKKS